MFKQLDPAVMKSTSDVQGEIKIAVKHLTDKSMLLVKVTRLCCCIIIVYKYFDYIKLAYLKKLEISFHRLTLMHFQVISAQDLLAKDVRGHAADPYVKVKQNDLITHVSAYVYSSAH